MHRPRPAGSSRRRSTQRPRRPAGRSRKRSRPSSTVRRSPPARDVCAAARPASVRCRTTRRTSWAKRSAAPTCSSSGLRPTGGGMAARLKLLFERLVPVFMGESPRGIPQPRLKGRAGRRHRRLHHAVALQSALPPEPGRRAQRTRSALDGRHAHPLGRDRRHQSARRCICPKPPGAKSNGSWSGP